MQMLRTFNLSEGSLETSKKVKILAAPNDKGLHTSDLALTLIKTERRQGWKWADLLERRYDFEGFVGGGAVASINAGGEVREARQGKKFIHFAQPVPTGGRSKKCFIRELERAGKRGERFHYGGTGLDGLARLIKPGFKAEETWGTLLI